MVVILLSKIIFETKNFNYFYLKNNDQDTTTWFGTKLTLPTEESINNESGDVGKYLKSPTSSTPKKRNFNNEEFDTELIKKKPKATGYNFGDFSNW